MKVDDIRIPEPCNEDWERMTPKQRGRFCGACQKKVHDLSAMSEADAKAVLASGGDICISYLSDDTGAIHFQPPRIVPLSRLSRRASATAAAGLAIALAACAPHGEGPSIDDAQTEQAALLEVHPSIPDVEPCDGKTPETEEDQPMMRTLGEPVPERPAPPPERRKATPEVGLKRTAGAPTPSPRESWLETRDGSGLPSIR